MCRMKKIAPPDFKPVWIRKSEIIRPSVWGHNVSKQYLKNSKVKVSKCMNKMDHVFGTEHRIP